ncbi:DUF4249 domain-containing protein [Mucilaginibacter sp. RS28]|uniref:DUF4249 domain-containing protein n=1 Tax=Mucilaginibacter straminoryzae TaxID=2932774 RepID=A0A9X2B9H1_9SPHI|nr:DUF4249 domain-containing protein [Mucilaginibacter straminoryzae]MCJ8209745.1 DUF4249 domain-containing protein [Mucilaginibacter straminoryzae]
MKRILYNLLFFSIVALVTSCQDVIDLKVNSSDSQIVIEGNITDQPGTQTIKISKSVSYTSSNTYPAVTGAKVVVTDSKGNTLSFVESVPGTYTFGPFKGEPGNTYTLNVNINGNTYTAVSTMPQPVKIDSLGLKEINFGGKGNFYPEVHYQDPANIANYYRYVMYINGVLTKRIYSESDRLTNGKAVTETLFYDTDEDNKKLEKGDKVDVEMQCIDQSVYTYWHTLDAQNQNGPGGGTAPGNPPSNISNKALGYFSAHAVSKASLSVK